MIVMTMSSSSSEKPEERSRRLASPAASKFVERESVLEGVVKTLYQSEYFVPSVAVPVDWE